MSEATRERAIDETPSQVTGRTITRWGWPLHRVGLAVYVLVLVVYIVRVGVPIDRIGQTGWILVGIVAARLGPGGGAPFAAHCVRTAREHHAVDTGTESGVACRNRRIPDRHGADPGVRRGALRHRRSARLAVRGLRASGRCGLGR